MYGYVLTLQFSADGAYGTIQRVPDDERRPIGVHEMPAMLQDLAMRPRPDILALWFAKPIARAA